MWSYVDQDSGQSRVIRNRAMDLRDTQLFVGKCGYLSYINLKKRVASNVPIVAIDVTSGPLTVTCD